MKVSSISHAKAIKIIPYPLFFASIFTLINLLLAATLDISWSTAYYEGYGAYEGMAIFQFLLDLTTFICCIFSFSYVAKWGKRSWHQDESARQIASGKLKRWARWTKTICVSLATLEFIFGIGRYAYTERWLRDEGFGNGGYDAAEIVFWIFSWICLAASVYLAIKIQHGQPEPIKPMPLPISVEIQDIEKNDPTQIVNAEIQMTELDLSKVKDSQPLHNAVPQRCESHLLAKDELRPQNPLFRHVATYRSP